MKLFVSYARVDKPLCKQVVSQLDAVHDVWYDRRLHAGMDWWTEIQEKLDWCEGFVYLLSPEAVASEYCQKEFAIATESGKHIFPVLIQARTDIPKSLSHIHYADLSQGMEEIVTLLNAITLAERRQWAKPNPAPKVEKPAQPPKAIKPSAAISQAADAMEVENFDSAVFILKGAIEKNPIGRTKRILLSMLQEADTALERQSYLREAQREYAQIAELVKRNATQAIGCEELADFLNHYPDYDPDGPQSICGEVQSSPVTVTRSSISDILPAPFEWVEIPAGQVTLENLWDDDGNTYVGKKGASKTISVDRFAIAKYPITNAQFATFIDAGGYNNQSYWTDAGWQQKQKDKWTQPRYWDDSEFNGATQPVVGISWYEAFAFTQWLSETSGEKIQLPDEQQWQRAAQGDDNRTYPWGNDWDSSNCQSSVGGDWGSAGNTTSVTQFEGVGDSPFGVVDMAGNVFEWCLTEYDTGSNNSNGTNVRVLRGGSWLFNFTGDFRVAFRGRNDPNYRYFYTGFRIARSYTRSES